MPLISPRGSALIKRILIVGHGSMGKRHLRLARGLLPNADIRVLRHQVTGEVPEFSNGCFFSIEEAITFAPQIAVIANPAPFHIATAQALANVGVNLLIEKPLSDSLDGVRQLLKTCKKNNIVLLTGYNLRFLPSLQCFRDLLGEGVIGKVLSVRCEIGQYLPSWRPDCDYQKTVSARREWGGGALLELSHEIDYLRWIFGEAVWVNATLSRQSRLEIDVEDTAHLVIGFAPDNGGHQLIASVNMDFIRHDTTRLCYAIGEKGSLRWDGLNGEVELFEAGAKAWRSLYSVPQQRDDSYLAGWTNFIESISRNKLPLVSGEDGLRVLEIIDAARQSAESGGRARVPAAINVSISQL